MARVWSTGKRKPENITSNETRSVKKPRLWNRELEYKTSDATKNENKPKGLFPISMLKWPFKDCRNDD